MAYVWLSQQCTLKSFDAAMKELPKILNFTNAASTLVNVTNQPSCPFERAPDVQVEPVLKTSPLGIHIPIQQHRITAIETSCCHSHEQGSLFASSTNTPTVWHNHQPPVGKACPNHLAKL